MGDINNILFDLNYSCRISFSIKGGERKKAEEYFSTRGLEVVEIKETADMYSVSVEPCGCARFKLLVADIISYIGSHCSINQHSRFYYTVEVPSVNASKLEFAINYGHTKDDDAQTLNNYMDAMLPNAVSDDYEFGWRGVTPVSFGNDTVITNNDIARLVYPHYEIDMREYNNRKITLVFPYETQWTSISMIIDYFASFASACAERKIDMGGLRQLNALKEKFNTISANFSDYASFRKAYGDKFLVSIDMDSEPTYIEAFFSMIKPELFRIYNLLYQCKPNGRKHIHINYDTDESRWQVNGFKCGKYGIDDVRELDLVNCELQSSRFYSCNLMNCTITDCSVSDGSLIGSCEISDCTIENCYCGQDTTISRCHIVANNTMDGRVEKSVIGDNNSYTEKASIDSESRNRNNRKT